VSRTKSREVDSSSAREMPRSVARSNDCLSKARSRSKQNRITAGSSFTSRHICHGRRDSCRNTSGNSVS
jgi:hypothetical protein